MRITQTPTVFRPVTIVLETQEELDNVCYALGETSGKNIDEGKANQKCRNSPANMTHIYRLYDQLDNLAPN